MKKVSDLIVECLEAEGVRYVFGVPGEENEDLLFSMAHSTQIEFVPTRHESGAAFIADVWGRISGKAGVCLATLGPGATNLITGVADANSDKAPVVAITGQGGIGRMHHESHQLIDVVGMYAAVTKWNSAIHTPEVTTEVLRKAFKLAEAEKPGATHIELSEDVAKEIAKDKLHPIQPKRVRRPGADYKAIAGAIELLKASNKPLIIAGNGAIRKRASKHLTLLSEAHKIPVAGTFMGKGALSDKSDQSLLAIGLGFKDYVIEAAEEADLIIAVGYDIAEFPPQRFNPNGDKKIIHIDFEPAEVYTHYETTVEVVGDVSDALWEINHRIDKDDVSFNTNWYAPIRAKILDDIASYTMSEGDDFTVPGTLNIVREILDDDGLLLSDVGSHKMWIARNFPSYSPNGVIMSNGFASMGIALPGGIAAKLLDSKRQVVAAMGDGGFMMNSQELETAKRLGVGFVNIVFNDNDYGLISWKQRMNTGGKQTSTTLTNPDFKAYAESFGIKGYQPSSINELKETLKHTISTGELCVIEVKINASVNQELFDKMKTYFEKKEG